MDFTAIVVPNFPESKSKCEPLSDYPGVDAASIKLRDTPGYEITGGLEQTQPTMTGQASGPWAAGQARASVPTWSVLLLNIFGIIHLTDPSAKGVFMQESERPIGAVYQRREGPSVLRETTLARWPGVSPLWGDQ